MSARERWRGEAHGNRAGQSCAEQVTYCPMDRHDFPSLVVPGFTARSRQLSSLGARHHERAATKLAPRHPRDNCAAATGSVASF